MRTLTRSLSSGHSNFNYTLSESKIRLCLFFSAAGWALSSFLKSTFHLTLIFTFALFMREDDDESTWKSFKFLSSLIQLEVLHQSTLKCKALQSDKLNNSTHTKKSFGLGEKVKF